MAIYEEKKPVTATVYPKNGSAYTGYVIDGKTYKDAAGTQRIDSGSTVQMADGRQFSYNPATPVGIVDSSGKSGTGYIKDGATYLDEAGTQRVAPGTTVNTNNGSYYYGGAAIGGVPTAATAKKQYKSSFNDAMDMYGAATKAQNDAIDAAIRNAAADYALRRQQVRDNYGRANEEAERAYIKASNPYGPIAQRLEALGLGDSGYAETTYARLGNEYQRQISENIRAMEGAIAEIDLAETKARNEGDIQKANMLAQEKQQMAAAIIQMSGNMYNADMSNLGTAMNAVQTAETNEYNRKWAEEELAYNRAVAEQNTADQRRINAYALIQQGMIDDEIAAMAGKTVDEAWQMYYDFLKAQPVKATSGGGGSRKTPSPETAPVSAMDAYAMYLSAGDGVDMGTFAKAYWKDLGYSNESQLLIALQTAEGNEQGEKYTNINDFGAEYSTIWNNVRRMKDRGKSDSEIRAYLDSKKDESISDAGLEKILQNLGWL